MYAILGASGNTGHVVAKTLLERGQKVRAIGRNATHLQPLAAQGAEVFIADVTDASALTKAFQDADSAYVMIPPNPASNDALAYENRVGDAIATAVRSTRVKNIVSLSSIGADKPTGTGPVVGLYNLEQKLNRVDTINVLHLRAGSFMENTLGQAGAIRMMGSAVGPIRPDLKLPMIASLDIGAFAAERSLAARVPRQTNSGTSRPARSRLQRSRYHHRESHRQTQARLCSSARRSAPRRHGSDGNVRQLRRADARNGRRS